MGCKKALKASSVETTRGDGPVSTRSVPAPLMEAGFPSDLHIQDFLQRLERAGRYRLALKFNLNLVFLQ